MNILDLTRELCREKEISVSELARRMGQSPQNFNKKSHRDTLSTDELIQIAGVTGAAFV